MPEHQHNWKFYGFILQVVLALVWVALCWPGMTHWRESVPFVVFMSLYTIILEHVNAAYNAWLAWRKR